MKKILFTLVALCAFWLNATAQITLNRGDYAVTVTGTRNDTAYDKPMNTVGVARPTFGNNQVWDYTNLRDSIDRFVGYVSFAANTLGTPPAPFANATFYASGFGGISGPISFPVAFYRKLDNAGLYEMGYAHNQYKFPIGTVTGSATDTLEFLAALKQYTRYYEKFPITANSAWNFNYRDTSHFRLTVAGFGLNQVPGYRVSTMNQKDTIVGWGTLRMRNPSGGNPLNFAVLLRQRDRRDVDSFFLSGAPAPAVLLQAFGLQQGSTTQYYTLLDFLGVGYKRPFLSFYVSNNHIAYIDRAVLPTLGLTVNNAEVQTQDIAVKTFPNPATEGVFFEFDKSTAADWNIMIYNTAGQIVTMQPVSASVGATSVKVLLPENLAVGNYFYNVIDENSLIRAKGQFIKK